MLLTKKYVGAQDVAHRGRKPGIAVLERVPVHAGGDRRNGGDLVIEYREADEAEQYAREALKAERAAKKAAREAAKAARSSAANDEGNGEDYEYQPPNNFAGHVETWGIGFCGGTTPRCQEHSSHNMGLAGEPRCSPPSHVNHEQQRANGVPRGDGTGVDGRGYEHGQGTTVASAFATIEDVGPIKHQRAP